MLEVLQTLVANLVMEFAVHSLALLVHQLERVATVAVHVTVAVGSPAVGEQEGHLVARLWPQRQEVPEHIRILRENTRRE